MSFNIQILPDNISVSAEKNEILKDVLHRAGIDLEAACGGLGTCRRCDVQVIEGYCDVPAIDGRVLSCQAKITGHLKIIVPEPNGLQDIQVETEFPADDKYAANDEQLVASTDISPLSIKYHLKVPPVSRDEHTSDLERLKIQLSTQTASKKEPECSLSVLRKLPEVLWQGEGDVTVTLTRCQSPEESCRLESDGQPEWRLIQIDPGNTMARYYGIACDVGTTSVTLNLLDLGTGRLLGSASSYNGQIVCGADVISRIIYARKPENLKELTDRITETINRLLNALLTLFKVNLLDVTSAVFSGNTSMIHLLLGIDPKHIREDPYVPVVKFPPRMKAGALGINIHPKASVICTPGVGSYVGGDISSGLLYSIHKRQPGGLELYIDIGTNGELVIIGDEWMMGCACSAGPAFEGVGIGCGMRAADGAIQKIVIEDNGTRFSYNVIGGGKPRGICGSGLIDLVSCFYSLGFIGKDGRFDKETIRDSNNQKLAARLTNNENRWSFTVAEADETDDNKAIYITEQEIRNILRAKAAIFSGCSLLLKKVGLGLSDIQAVTISGGFGQSLDIEKAIALGLFPDIEPDRFEYIGNASLSGAMLTLLSEKHRIHIGRIARSMTYVDLSSELDYMDEYTAALFIPHTDLSLFPSLSP
ncbi:hypothetical protein BVY01_01570 [bacterium I07]|nr:hypothetical protein BVY01_01570 [bacterium I07]